MPALNYEPTAALVAGCDLGRDGWRGASVIRRFVTTATLPTWAAPGDGLFDDFLTALNGRGEHLSLGQRADAQVKTWDPLASMTITIDAEDRVLIDCTDRFNMQLNAGTPAAVALGFQTLTTYSSVVGGSGWILQAPAEWTRGNIEETVELVFIMDPLGTPTPLTVTASGFHQDVPTLLRSSGTTPTSDEDEAPFESLQYVDNEAFSVDDYNWIMTDDGRVLISWGTLSTGFDPDWQNDELKLWLGFTGAETVQVGSDFRYIKATRPPACVIIPDSLGTHSPGINRDGVAVAVGRQFYPVSRGDYPAVSISMYLRGPATADDQITHFHERFLPEVPQGGRINLYYSWGDPRRALRTHKTSPGGVVVGEEAYSLSRNSEFDGERGRLVGRLVPGVTSYRAEWTARVTTEARYSLEIQTVED